jgi:hypothetical protein
MKSQHNPLLFAPAVLAVVLLSTSSVFSQGTQRIVQWPEMPIDHSKTVSLGDSKGLAQIESLEIVDITVGGKSITLGQSFVADDDWLKSLTVRLKNVSNNSISKVQLNLFLTEIMPGGPLVTLFYGGEGQSIIMPGAEADLKLVFYSWLVDQINKKSSLAKITKAEIWNVTVTLPDGKRLFSTCVKTVSPKNACPAFAQ